MRRVIRRCVCAGIALAIALTTDKASADRGAPIAVIVVGDAAGDIEPTVFARLREAGVRRVPEAELAAALAAPPRPASEDVEIERALAAASDALFEGHLERAIRHLDRARRQLARQPFGGFEHRLDEALLRAGALEHAGEADSASAEARRALALDPDLEVDLARYWPSLATHVESERGSTERIVVSVEVSPPDAELWLSGRPARAPLEVGTGEHLIAARASGYRSVTRQLHLDADTKLKLRLPLAVPKALEHALADPGADPSGLAVQACAMLDQPRCLWIWAGEGIRLVQVEAGEVTSLRTLHRSALPSAALWVEPPLATSRLAPSSRSIGLGIVPFVTTSSTAAWGESSAEQIGEGGGIEMFAGWRDRQRGHGLFGRARASFVRSFRSPIETRAIDTALPGRAEPGWDLLFALDAGYRVELWSDRLFFQPLVRASGHHVRIRDAVVDGERVGLFPATSYLALSPGLELRAEAHPKLALFGDLALSVLGVHLRGPEELGRGGAPTAADVGAGVSLRLAPRWELELGARFRIVTASLAGAADAAIEPAPIDVDTRYTSGGGYAIIVWRP